MQTETIEKAGQNGSRFVKSLGNSPLSHDVTTVDVGSVIRSLKQVIRQAVGSATRAVQDCLVAGQALNEARATFQQGRSRGGRFSAWDDRDGFVEFVEKNLPEIHRMTAWRWMSAAQNVLRAVVGEDLPEAEPLLDRFDLAPSVVLRTPDAELDAEALAFKRAWFEFTEHKTLKSCMAGMLVGAERAMNGKLLGGQGDRKDFAEFTLRKLKHLSTFFGSWDRMSERQKAEIKNEFAAAICGEEFKLHGRGHDALRAPVSFEPWPVDMCRVVAEAIRERLKNAR